MIRLFLTTDIRDNQFKEKKGCFGSQFKMFKSKIDWSYYLVAYGDIEHHGGSVWQWAWLSSWGWVSRRRRKREEEYKLEFQMSPPKPCPQWPNFFDLGSFLLRSHYCLITWQASNQASNATRGLWEAKSYTIMNNIISNCHCVSRADCPGLCAETFL